MLLFTLIIAMDTARVLVGALLVAGAVAQTASSCSSILVPAYSPPSVASGWQAQLVATGLRKPRSIQFDGSGALLVVESGKGVTRNTFKDNGGTCLQLEQSTLLINRTELNHGLALSADGKTLYASSSSSVYAWAYDPTAGTVGQTPREVVANMTNNDLVTRTLLMSAKEPDVLIVSRGSADTLVSAAQTLSSGLSQIRAFNLTNLTGSAPYSFGSEGTVLGWGLRNSVGVVEHPVTGGIYGVENSVDGVQRDGVDIHENNPGEELNYFGVLGSTQNQGGHYGYPRCFAVWDLAEIPNHDGLEVGSQFAIQENSTLTDETCASDYIAPRLTFSPHMAPLDIKFDAAGTTAYITFHGSFDKTDPVGYRLSSIAFNAATGEPVAASDSTTALSDIISNPDHTKCPDNCFRPVGLAWDSAGRLWMSSDTTGELYVLQKTSSTPTATASGTIVTPTGTRNASPRLGALDSQVLAFVAAFLATVTLW
ncbi:soluble quino protein glucose dehydrogenase [Thozetella sp. PMI_491]|nr:soluble quino protein glucose dehydrogenase [Thozetella sp. PMI_491]